MGVVFWDVIEEHLDEAEFLWASWESALHAHDETLAGVEERVEERLFAQIDGLQTGGAAVRDRVLVPALESAEGPRRTAAAFALASSNDPAALAAVVDRLRDGDAAARADVGRALGLAEADGLHEELRSVLTRGSPPAQAAALDVLAFRGTAPAEAGVRADDEPALVVAALHAALASGDPAYKKLALDALASADVGVRDAALAAGLALGVPEAWKLCRKLASEASEQSTAGALEKPLVWLGMGGDARDVGYLVFALRLPALRGAALAALAVSGRSIAADACVPWIGDPEVGALAADAFVAITGMPLSKEVLAEDGAIDPASQLPLLRRAAVEAWWTAGKGRFDRSHRYFLGRPATFETAVALLAHGPMRRRAPLAAEIAIRGRGHARVEPHAFAARQRAEIARLRPLAEGFDHAFG